MFVDADRSAEVHTEGTAATFPGKRMLAIASGGYGSCALLAPGDVKCWGENADGQLGLGDKQPRGGSPNDMGSALPALDFGTDTPVRALTAGFAHACVLFEDGFVKCWGRNALGQLGLGDTASRGGAPGEMGQGLPVVQLGLRERPVAISAGADHTCALLADGGVKCWGFNYSGQLGLGHSKTRGNAQGEMGDNLSRVDLGTANHAIALAAGGAHTCVLLQDHTVKCWGDNHQGELGLGDRDNRGDDPGEMGDALPRVDLGPGAEVRAIAAGWEHTCAVLMDGTVRCWGHNDSGQLGLGDTKNRGGHVGEMGIVLPAVDLGGEPVSSIAAGVDHTCVSFANGAVKCWGNNDIGQLGLGDSKDRGIGAGQMGNQLPCVDLGTHEKAVALALGAMHTCALLQSDRVKCWGDNYAGQLGVGDTENRGDAPGEMGNALPGVLLFGTQ